MRKNRWMEEIKRTVAVALIVTMLPFSSFAEIGYQTVYGATIPNETTELTVGVENENVLSGNGQVYANGQNSLGGESHGAEGMEGTEENISEKLPVLELSEDKVLEEDWTVEEELVVTGGSLDLNGHTLTVSSNMIHSGGRITFNGGRLVVQGDYRRQSREQDADGNYIYSNANADCYLNMNSQEDYFLIEGDFYESSESNSYMWNGCTELKGSFYQSDTATGQMYGGAGHWFILSGDEKQVFHCKEDGTARITYRNLSVTNVSEEGIVFEGVPYVEDKFISSRDSHIEGRICWTGYEFPYNGYYGGDVVFDYGKTIRGAGGFEFGGNLYAPSYTYFYTDLKVDGNLYVNASLGVYSELTVEGDIVIEDGDDLSGTHHTAEYVSVASGGRLTVKGNVAARSSLYATGIYLSSKDAYVLIEGDYSILSSVNSCTYCNYGTVEVKGNILFNQEVYFNCGATLLLSGDEKQSVRVMEKCRFNNIVILNTSEEGVCFEDYIYYDNLVLYKGNASYRGTPIISGFDLEEDMTITGDVVLSGAPMNLNGHTLTIEGNLFQKNSVLNINNGKLIVKGNYSMGEPETMWINEKGKLRSTGALIMTGQNDYVQVEGNFYAASGCPGHVNSEHSACKSILESGVLEVKGDVVAKGIYEYDREPSMEAGGNHTLLLSGSGKQRVWIEDNSYINHLTVTNTGEEGVEFIGEPKVRGFVEAGRDTNIKGAIRINDINNIKNGYYSGSIIAQQSMTIEQYMEIGGDFIIRDQIEIKGAKLTVNGNLEIAKNTGDTKNAGLVMENETAHVLVKGNYQNESSATKAETGLLEVQGDFTDHTDLVYGTEHRVLFSGSSLQTITTTATLGIVELQNPAGVFSERAFEYSKLILNGYKLTVGSEDGIIGEMLEEDRTVDGDLYLVAGKLDLNGHTLRVKGDLILQEGTININHGKLIVEGDYRQQFRTENETGYDYSESYGMLCMLYEDDVMSVEGDFILMPSKSSQVQCKQGTLEIGGNVTAEGNYSFVHQGTVILNGKEKQQITARNAMTWNELQITNSSLEGVLFETNVTVEGRLSDTEYRAGGSQAVALKDLNNLEQGRFGGNLDIAGSGTLNQDLDIRGTLGFAEKNPALQLYCGTQNIHVKNLQVRQELYVQKAQITVEENLYKTSNGKIEMSEEEGYILVNGDADFNYQNYYSNIACVLEAGTIEIKGDYRDYSNGDYGINHRILLSGSSLQTVDITSKLGTLELENHSAEGVYSSTTIKKKKLIYNGCRLVIGDGTGIYGFTLTEDYVVEGDCTLLDDTLDLNGRTMTVKGNLLLQEGVLNINGGTLIVEGNLQIQAKHGNPYSEILCGCLEMENDEDLVKIDGDLLIYQEAGCNCKISKGKIELQGDLKRLGSVSGTCDIGCDLALTGQKAQELNAYNLRVKNLTIENRSEEGVKLVQNMTLTGSLADADHKLKGAGYLCIQDLNQLDNGCYGGNVLLDGECTMEGNVSIDGTLDIKGILHCGNHTLKSGGLNVPGKLYVDKGTIQAAGDMNLSGELHADKGTVRTTGNLYLSGKLYTDRGTIRIGGNLQETYAGSITMDKTEAYIAVNGDVIFQMPDYYYQTACKNDFTDGVLEIKGNFTKYKKENYGSDHRIILSGTALQTINIWGGLGTLELQNYSEEGVYSKYFVKIENFIQNGCKFVIGDGTAIYGTTLTEDYALTGDVALYGDTLDLNGHTMTVKGDLKLVNGEIRINGGTLIVEGNLYIQENEEYESSGCLIMENEKDKVQIGGNWIIQPHSSCHCLIEKGTIELAGDLQKNYSGYTDIYNIGCKLVLNGDKKQIVSAYDGNIRIQNLTLSNSSKEGIYFNYDTVINGEVEYTGGKVQGRSIILTDINQLRNGSYGGSVILDGDCTQERDVEIEGNLVINGKLHCAGQMLQAESITVNGKLFTDEAVVIADSFFIMGSQGLLAMTNADAYVLVKGSFTFGSAVDHRGYLTDGVLEVMQNIFVERNCPGFVASGGHYTIFRRRNETDNRISQTVSIPYNSNSSIHFAKLELTKYGEDEISSYSFSGYSAEELADEVIYVGKGVSIPNPVSQIHADEVTESSVTLSYTGNWSDGSNRNYIIYRDGVKIATTKNTVYQDTSLEPGRTYTYQVYPCNIDWQMAKSSPSCQITTLEDTIAPDAPVPEVAVRSGSAITLKWNKPYDNVAVKGYRLYRDGQLIYEGSETTYKDKGLEENTLYTYYVKAFDTSGNESEESDRVDGAVYMPRILSVTPEDYEIVGGEQLEISVLCENQGNSTGNSLTIEYYDEKNDRWITITKPALGQKENTKTYVIKYTWDIGELNMGSDVDLRFILTDIDGNSTEKLVTYTVDCTAPAAPAKVRAEDDGGIITISWDISKSADCAGYLLYRMDMETKEAVLLGDITGRNSSWYQDSSVEDGKTYGYYLVAYDGFGNKSLGTERVEITAAEDTKAPRVTAMTPEAGKVNKRVIITVTGKDNRAVTAFSLYIRQNQEEEWEELAKVDAKDNQAVYTWDTAEYEEGNWYIKAVAEDANGNESEELFMRRYEVDNTGIAKIRLLEPAAGSTTIQLAWEDVEEEDFGWFLVEERTEEGWKEIEKVYSQLGIRIENIKPDSTHTYRVTGYDTLGNAGVPSDTVTVATESDTSGPNIASIEPVSSYYKDSISLSMRVKDNAAVERGVFSYSVSGNGFEEIATVSGNGKTEETLRYTWDISGLPEGEVTVRFEAYDRAGNHNTLYEEKQIENTYFIDRTAPGKVEGLHITDNEGCIRLAWDSVSDNDISTYIIERATEEDGIFKTIMNTGNTLAYTDTGVKENVCYVYRITAKDIAGNMGEPSEEITGIVKPDEEAPVVTGISPAQEIIGSNPTLKILAIDNASLKEVTLEYREKESEESWHEIAVIPLSGREQYKTVTWNTDGLLEETVYEVRAKAVDRAGNESEYAKREYYLDLTPPKAPELTAESASFAIEINYTENEEEDFRCYKIYRREYGEREYTCIQATTQTSFTDAVPKTDTTYYYKVRAYDIYDNYSESNITYSYANHVDKIASVAELPETVFGFTGMEVAFDGTMCSDNVRINRYQWDFGDGTKASGVRPVHTYEKSGTYSMTLTVWDGAGNKATAVSAVQIMDQTNQGSALIRVLSKDRTPLAGAYVYVKTGNGENDVLRLRTDRNGEVKVIAKAGAYEYAAYAQDYMPAEGVLRLSSYETPEENVVLEKGEVVTGNLTVKRMELDELIEKGVDLSAPENYNTFTLSVELWFASCPLPVVFMCTERDDLIYKSNSTDTGKSLGTFTQGESTIQVELLTPGPEKYEDTPCNPAITYLQTTQSVSWLKDMYDVQLGIINNADSGYTITNASATLNLPEGMSLATTKSGQTLNTQLPDIDGQESVSASWVVKGDRSGKFRPSATFHGILQPFQADLDAQFETEMECVVPAGEGLHIYVYPEDAYYPGENYYIQFQIRNESNRCYYNLDTTLGEYIQPSHIEEAIIKDVNTGDTIKVARWGGKTYRSTTAAKCSQLPVLYDGDLVNVGILAPGETIYATYCKRMGEQKSESTYFVLRDSLVRAIEGENLGVEVSVVPKESHIYKYVMVVGERIYLNSQEELDELMGDPVDMTTGAFLQELNTITLNGGNELSFGLHYNSMLAEFEGEAGYGWSHDYEQWIEDRGSTIVLHMDSYSETNFINEEANSNIAYGTVENDKIVLDGETEYEGKYHPEGKAMEGWEILKNEDGYIVTASNDTEYIFDKAGRLIHMEDVDGRSISLSYVESMTEIKDNITGESLFISYDNEGKISNISDSCGRNVKLYYNGGNLTGITGLDGNTSTYAYDLGHHMIHATNGDGLTYVKNTYDEEGRILTQEETGKAGRMSMSYSDTDNGGVEIITTYADGKSMTVITNARGQKIKTIDVDGAVAEYLYDRNGNLLDETDSYGNTVMYQYDEDNHLVQTYDTAGNITFMEYDGAGNPVRIYDRNGAGNTFAYDEKNRLTRSVDELGEVIRYVYDEQGNLIRQITDGKGTLQYEYAGGRLISQTDANGNRTTFEYDIYGNISKKTDAAGAVTLYNYSQAGQLIVEIAPDGLKTAYTYDKTGQMVKCVRTATDGTTRTERYAYDGAGRITQVTDAAGNSMSYTYDSYGNKTSTTYADGSRDVFVYDAGNNLIKKTTAGGAVTEYTYDLNHNMLSETTDGLTVSYEYYPNGKVYKQILPDGQTYTYTYDSSWNCILVKDSQGNSTGYTYDVTGNQTSVRDALGNTTYYAYDNHGRCIKVTDPNGNSTSYVYDSNGNCIRQTDALGNITYMTYDAANRLVRSWMQTEDGETGISYSYDVMGRTTGITDEEGVTTRITYDAFGNIQNIFDGEGNRVQTNEYDVLGQLISTADAIGNTTAYSYNSLGNVTKLVEALNTDVQRESSYTYDNDGRIFSAVDAAGSTLSQTYDNRGNITAVTDALGGKTSYSYDSMNRVTKVVNAIGGTQNYTYNAEGLLAESRNADGEKTVYEYDAAGRIIKQKDSLGTITYTYDKNSNILTVSDKNGTITRSYDKLNRVTSVTDYRGDTISYAYDQLGNRISITYPGGEKVRYTYDRTGRLETVTDAEGRTTYYTYDKNGSLVQTVRADGSKETRTYNAAGQMTALKDETAAGEVISDYGYEYDSLGNITKITGMEGGKAESLTGESSIIDSAETAADTVLVSVSMTYDADNRLLTYNGQDVEYDKEGNMVKGPLNGDMAEFTYDCRNRLVKVKETDGTVTTYEYDAENVRTAVISKGVRTEYTTDRESVYSQTLVKTEYEKNPFGSYTKQTNRTVYIYGQGLVGEIQDDGKELYYHYNHLGSTMAVTDGDGNILYRFVYDTYGELSDIQNGNGASLKTSEEIEEFTAGYTLSELASAAGIEYLYNGQYGVSMGQNGLYYMRARYYNQNIKRFINRDVVSGEITNSGSLNRYCYVQGNPVSLTDPFGLCPDSNSAFKNLCSNLYHMDWNALGHAALDVAGIFFDGADVINAIWYACEGNMEMAAASAICAIPALGMATGNLLMKSNKLAAAGKAVKAIAKMTQGVMGVCAGIEMAKTGFTNFLDGLEAGTFDAGAFLQTLGGIGIAVLSGKGLASSGQELLACTGNSGKTIKGIPLDADISNVPIESEGMATYTGGTVLSDGSTSSRYNRIGYQSNGRSNNLFGQDRPTRRTTNLTEWRRSISKQDIHNEMRLFLGDDYVKVDAGKWRSLDGTRQFRVTPNDYLGNHGIGYPSIPNTPHVHFEFLAPRNNGNGFNVVKNVHVPIK